MENGCFEDAERSGCPMKVLKTDDTLSLKKMRVSFNNFRKKNYSEKRAGVDNMSGYIFQENNCSIHRAEIISQ